MQERRALRLRFSQSLASLRHRLSQASVRSTIQRFGKTTNPFVRSERLTISPSDADGPWLERWRIPVPDSRHRRTVFAERIHPEQGGHDENAAVAILNVGRMHNSMQQQPYCIDENMPLLALDFLARIVTRRIDADPPFSALFTLWLSMMAALGPTSRSDCSRHCS